MNANLTPPALTNGEKSVEDKNVTIEKNKEDPETESDKKVGHSEQAQAASRVTRSRQKSNERNNSISDDESSDGDHVSYLTGYCLQRDASLNSNFVPLETWSLSVPH